MKPRKVVLTVELTSGERVDVLKEVVRDILEEGGETTVDQISANVIKPERGAKK